MIGLDDKAVLGEFLRRVAAACGHEGGVTIVLHARTHAEGERTELRLLSSLNNRTEARLLLIETLFQSLIADGVTPENCAAFAMAELEAAGGKRD